MKNRSLSLVVATFLVAAAPAPAATRTWSGAVNNAWSVAGNWVESSVPADGDDLVFPAGAVSLVPANDLSGLSVGSLTVDGGYGLSGNAITLGPGGLHGTGSGTSTIWLDATLPGATTFLVDAGAYDMWLGVLSGPGGIVKTGAGKLELPGTNTYLGTTDVNAGFLAPTASAALGATTAGTTVASGATLQVSSLGPEPITLNGAGVPGYGALLTSTSGTVAGPLTLATDATVYIGGGTLTLSGTISGPGKLTVGGGGTLELLGASPAYTAGLVVFNGILRVNGDVSGAPVSFGPSPALVLGGTGSVGDVLSGGNAHVIAPSLFSVDAGTLATGNLQLDGVTTYSVYLPGPSIFPYDQLAVSGSVTINPLGAALQVNLGSTPAVGDAFTIVANDGADAVSGTFVGLPQGATLVVGSATFQISYTGGSGNDVVLTVTATTPVELLSFSVD